MDFDTRDIVFGEGSGADEAALLISGVLEVSLRTRRTQHHIAVINAGELVGESALFVNGMARTATVMANQPSRCLMLTPDVLGDLAEIPAVIALERYMVAAISRRIKKTNLEIQSAWADVKRAPQQSKPKSQPPVSSFGAKLRSLFKSG